MRQVAKRLLNGIALVAALPIAICFFAGAAAMGRQAAFPGFSQLVSLIPGYCGQFMRRAFYQLVLPTCGQDVCIGFGTIVSHASARIGDRAYVGRFCMLGDVDIGSDVLIGSNVSIINGNRQHGIERLDIPVREQPGEFPKVAIGTDSWIGDRAIVMADVGKHCVVGAGSVVTKPVPDFAIVVGNPARMVGSRQDLPDLEHQH